MPGMAASTEIFAHISLPDDQFDCYYLDWLSPESPRESLQNYCLRIGKNINHENPVLIGVSFGGIIVQELSRMLDARKVIIISSIKSTGEFPRRMQLARSTGLHKLLPTSLAPRLDQVQRFVKGNLAKKLQLYKKYLYMDQPEYLDWALEAIVRWERTEADPSVIHIHGTKDPVFPARYLNDYIPVEDGTHIMIINRYRWFNEHLPRLILS